MVESLCAMINTVLFFIKFSIACWTIASDLLSRADVASSKIKIGALRKKALAMAILCFCPPDNWAPRSPISVSKPSGKFVTNSSKYADFNACCISSSLAFAFPSKILSRIVPLKRKLS